MIAQHHLDMLAESGISEARALARGYETITDIARLTALQIAQAGRNVPGLLVPQLRADGTVWGYQYRPDAPRLRDNKPVKYETPVGQSNGIDVPPGVGPMLTNPNIPLFITEGVKKADCGAAHKLCIVAIPGVWSWRGKNTEGGTSAVADFNDISLNDRKIILAFDGDVSRKPDVRKALTALAGYLIYRGAVVEYLHLPDTDKKTGLDDYLMNGHAITDLWKLVKLELPPMPEPDEAQQLPLLAIDPVKPITLDLLHSRFLHWFGQSYDLDAIDAALAAAAVEKFTDGSDPLWLLLVSGPGGCKTETIMPLHGAGAVVASTIASPAGLLSGTPKKERSKDATGGLLRKLGDHGVIVFKDFTSILSMNPNGRAEMLSAFREIYDGQWTREMGTDGGRTLTWSGRITIVGAVTTAWDRAHAAIAAMGDRFALLRMDSDQHRLESGAQAIGNTGMEVEMRAELAELAGGVIAGADINVPATIELDEMGRILAAANLVTKARTAVEFDFRGDVVDAHAPEAPTRFAKQLAQVMRGAISIGLSREEGLRLAIRVARDSMPPLRLGIIDDISTHPHSTSTDVRKRLDKPRATVDRQLQALHTIGVLTLHEVLWGEQRTRWTYTLGEHIDPTALFFPKNDLDTGQSSVQNTLFNFFRLNKESTEGESATSFFPVREPGQRDTDTKASGTEGTDAVGYQEFLDKASLTNGQHQYERKFCKECEQPLLSEASLKRGFCERCKYVKKLMKDSGN